MPSDKNRPLKYAFVVLAFVFAILWFFKDSLMTSVGRLIMADTTTQILDGEPAVLLMGDRTGERAQSALAFLSAYPASTLLLAPEESTFFIDAGLFPHGHEVHKKFLVSSGISEDRIFVPECYNTSTRDEALCFRDFMRTHWPDAKSVVVITSWYHSSRATWTFERVFAGSGIAVKSYLPDRPYAKPDLWWKKEYTFIAVFNEYLKWAYWLIKTV